jgi:hypothetical protein
MDTFSNLYGKRQGTSKSKTLLFKQTKPELIIHILFRIFEAEFVQENQPI